MIIGLLGFIGQGKGTVADILETRHGFIKESFANSVKDATAVIFGWDRKMLEGDTTESRAWRELPDEWWSNKMGKPFSPRLALQLMGTEAGRDVFHEDLWVLAFQRRVQEGKNYVLADVRFPNEVKAIQNMGGKLIRVKRGPNPEWYHTAMDFNMKVSTVKPDVHYSEWAWIGSTIDATLDNNCDLHQLQNRVDKLVDSLYNNGVESFDDAFEVNV